MIFSYKRITLITLVSILTGVIVLFSYCWYLSGKIEKRFSGRKWQIPSTVYSDTTLLFPGKKINFESLQDKLRRIGYKKTDEIPESKGEYTVFDTGIEIYLKDLNIPDNIREGVHVIIDIDHNTINKIRLADTDGSLSLIEIGPEVIMQYFGQDRELRHVVSLKNVPLHVINAIIAAEDSRFFKHLGFDPFGIIRAIFINFKYNSIRQGGSTLTQQLAKNYFLTSDRTIKRKISEFLISIAMELKYSKEEILEIYLNEIYLGQKGSVSINGIGEASEFYFGKQVENLSVSEGAVIAGLIKGPNIYSPYADMDKCIKRRDSVLSSMLYKKMLTVDEYKKAVAEPIKTIGFKKYNRMAPYYMDYVSMQLNILYPESTLSSMGFSIYTTLDTEVQQAAEDALDKGLCALEEKNPELLRDKPEEKLQGAILVMQPRTGNIIAMVGGRDYKESQFNRVTQARRQPGSCFKPIMAACLLDKFKPSDLLSNEEKSYTINGSSWTPKNYSDIPQKKITIRDMLRLSCNRAAVDMAVRGGLRQVADGAKLFHFKNHPPPYPSIALGSFEVVPLELARAYCVFASDGVQPYPLTLKDVADENREVLVRQNMDINTVITPEKAFLITSMLESVVTDGTAKSLKNLGIDYCLAGKTGTSNDCKDAWFIGYTPDFLVLVWVGFDNGDSIQFTGSEAALPIFADLVKHMPGYITQNSFSVPPGIVKRKICKESGKLALPVCSETYEEYFLETNKPEMTCNIHLPSSVIDKFIHDVKKIFK